MAIRRRHPVTGISTPTGGIPGITRPSTSGLGTAQAGKIDRNKTINRRRRKTRENRRIDRAVRKTVPVDTQDERVIERGLGKGIPNPKPTPKATPNIKRPGGKKGPRVVRTTSGAAPSSGSARAPSGGGGGGGAPVAATAAPAAKKKGGKKKVVKGKKGTPKTAATPVPKEQTPQEMIRELMEPALSELDRQSIIADRTRHLQAQDVEGLRNWMGGQHQAGEDFLGKQLAASREAAAVQSAPDANSIGAVGTEVAGTMGTSADLRKASGFDAANQINAGYTPAMEAMRQNPELLASSFSAALAGGRGVTNANIANLLSGVQGRYQSRQSELGTERSKLMTEMGVLGQKETADRRQASLDQDMFNLIAKEKLGNLKVKQTEAVTNRLRVISTAENARAALNWKQQIDSGKLSLAQAREQFKQQLEGQKLTISKKKLELARFDTITKANTGAQEKATNYVTKRYEQFLKQFGAAGVPANWDAIDRGQQRKIVRQLISGMKSAGGDKLTQAQAISILGGVLGDIPVRDPAFRKMITTFWRN